MKIGWSLLLLIVVSPSILAQTSDAAAPSSAGTGKDPTSVAGNSAASIVPELDKLKAAASQAAADIGRLRIEKWKANSSAKSAAQADADSVQRNLNSALPGLIDAARTSPGDLNAEFKLYRNLNALYDVFGTLTEATRVFGQKGEYEALSQQLQVISSVRRNLGESLEQLTADTQRELNQTRIQVKTQQEQLAVAQAEAAKPKQIVVAQTEPPKKAPKKKAAPKKPDPAANSSSAPSSTTNSSSQTGPGTSVPKS
jgi:hypothetical protein